jgi:hypothetical protein
MSTIPPTTRIFLVFSLLALALAWLGGCRKFNDEPPVQTLPDLQGSYVGVASINGVGQNVLLSLVGPDSTGHITGTIHHNGGAWVLSSAALDTSGDTVRFAYHPGDFAEVTDSAWALRGSTGLRVHYLPPAAIPVFDLNREVGGTNITGLWTGQMYSRFLDVVRAATMDLSQTGDLYGGTVDVTLVQNAHCQITTGITSGGSFQLSGVARMGQTDYPVVFSGNYAGLDSLVGSWQLGANPVIDDGNFAFRRNF